MADYNYIVKRVKETVLFFDPDAEIILYGSRARGSAGADSDWDFLILTEIDLDIELKNNIRHELYDVELETSEVIVPIIHEKEYWRRPQNSVTPFYQNVSREGIAV